MGQRLHRKEILRIIKSDILGNQHQEDELLLGSQLENIIILERRRSAGRFSHHWENLPAECFLWRATF